MRAPQRNALSPTPLTGSMSGPVYSFSESNCAGVTRSPARTVTVPRVGLGNRHVGSPRTGFAGPSGYPTADSSSAFVKKVHGSTFDVFAGGDPACAPDDAADGASLAAR